MQATSILKGTISEADAFKQAFLPQTIQRPTQALEQFARFVDTCENLALNGAIFSVGQTKVNATPEMFKQEAPQVFEELQSIAKGGRALLESLGFSIKTNIAPAALIGNSGNITRIGAPTGAAALVQPTQTETPGQPPLSGAVISPVEKPKK